MRYDIYLLPVIMRLEWRGGVKMKGRMHLERKRVERRVG